MPQIDAKTLLNSDEEELIASLEREFLQAKFCQPEFLAYDDPASQLGTDSIDPKEAIRILLAPSERATELVETWDFEGNVVGYKEVPVGLESLSQEKMSLMEPSSRPAAKYGSDPLTGFVKMPFWPGGIDKTPQIGISEDDFAKPEEPKVDPWDFSTNGFRTSVSGFAGEELPNDEEKLEFPGRNDLISQEELLLEPFDNLLPKEEEAPTKPPVVLDLTKMNLPTLTTAIISDTNYRWAIRVDPREAVSSAEFRRKIPEPARQYEFELDIFQKQAVLRLEEHENVFVAAHTSAGKTVVAEYAIAMAIKHKARVIYTSPIKALSNQKFRDFKETFGDVGIITGDIQLHPEASCLIMTTEILRSMLYNGSDVIRDTEWVIFDEVHYVNDPERGHVWEEAMILLPDNLSIVGLSATVPNAMDFAEWIGQIKKRKVFVITTAFRPVPLEHNLCITWGVDKWFPLLKPHSVALDQRIYCLAMQSKPAKMDSKQFYQQPGTLAPVQERQAYLAVIKTLEKKDNLPAVVFVFSKKKIEDLTDELVSKVDLLTAKERGIVHNFFTKSLSKLKEVDRKLPQILKILSLLRVGIGMHHSGVLPILKEIVEILFHRGLVKILFATETFSMGVNMPARTVVFDSILKNDGRRRRELVPSEYIQMAGRAGRRGIDTIGTVLILCRNEVPEISVLDRMMLGKPVHLESKFRLTTSLILGMMRVEHLKMEDILRRTFAEYGWFRQKSDYEAEYERLLLERRSLPKVDCRLCSSDILQYHSDLVTFWDQWARFLTSLLSERGASKVFTPGRLLFAYFANGQSFELRLAVFLTCAASNGAVSIRALVLMPPTDPSLGRGGLLAEPSSTPIPVPVSTLFPNILACPTENGDFKRPLANDLSTDLEAGRLKLEPMDLKPVDIAAFFASKSIKLTTAPHQTMTVSALGDAEGEVLKFLRAVKPPDWSQSVAIDPLKSSSTIQLSNLQLASDAAQLSVVRSQLASGFVCRTCENFNEHFRLVHNDQKIADRLSAIRHHLSAASLALGGEYEALVDILHQMGFIDKDQGVLLTKGRVACIIGQQHDVLITELLFSGVFNELSPSELAGVLSPFVTEARIVEPEGPKASPNLDKAVKAVKKAALEYGKLLHARNVISSPDAIITDDLRWGMVDAVYHWAHGMSFAEVKEITPIDEGLIVRCIQRVDELIRDLHDAAKQIGEVSLEAKLREAQNSIKRDIVFAGSLYLQ